MRVRRHLILTIGRAREAKDNVLERRTASVNETVHRANCAKGLANNHTNGEDRRILEGSTNTFHTLRFFYIRYGVLLL